MSIQKLNLILDLDNTLIYTIKLKFKKDSLKNNNNFLCDLVYNNSIYYVYSRPGLFDFLEKIYNVYDIYIFTLGINYYATIILNTICQKMNKNIFKKIYSRENFSDNKKILLDELNEFNSIIIDDNKKAWINNYNNIIEITPFYDINNYMKLDNELDLLLNKLDLIKNDYYKNNILLINI